MSEPILFAIWFFLPAGIANATPVIANKIPLLNRWQTPLDFGQKFRGKRIFGDNKTWRGVIFSSFVGGIVALLTSLLYSQYFEMLRLEPLHPNICAFLLGTLLGFGALCGDAAESFIKRQIGKKPGEKWFPFDQVDYIIGALLFVSPLIRPSVAEIAGIFIVWFLLHLLAAYTAYRLKLKDTPI